MWRFKCKKVIYILFISIFMLFCAQTKVEASEDYNIEIERIEGLVYGDNYAKAKIIPKIQDIEGAFSFAHPQRVANSIGEILVWITFTPDDIETYGGPISWQETAVVEKRNIEIVFETPIYKQYDGTTDVILPAYRYVGILDDEVTVVGNLTGQFSGSYVEEEVGIILSGVQVEGAKKDYYNLVLDGHSGRIHPSYINDAYNTVSIEFSKNVYVDVMATVIVEKEENSELVNDLYTSFMSYGFTVFDHNNEIISINGRYKVGLKIGDNVANLERLQVFEMDAYNNYKELSYTYNNGVMFFEMSPDSKIVFTTRNIEYNFIYMFVGILFVSFVFMIIYWIFNSRRGYARSDDE